MPPLVTTLASTKRYHHLTPLTQNTGGALKELLQQQPIQVYLHLATNMGEVEYNVRKLPVLQIRVSMKLSGINS